MKRIERLTETQKARMKSWADEWIAIGLSTERADWGQFEKAIRACYAYAGLRNNIPIIRVSSPIVGAFAAPIAANALEELLKEKKGSAVYSAVDSAVYSAVDSAVLSAVDSAVLSAVDSAVRSAKKKNKKIFWHYWLGGQFWSFWPSFTQFFIEVCGLETDKNEQANAYAELSKSAGYSWPNKNFVMVCDRPVKIQRDGNGRLHCEDSTAISWPDGWGLFMWHGTRVPAKLIMDPRSVTKEEVLAETNSEVSRAYAERLGWEKYFKMVDVVKMDAWTDPGTGLHYELYDFKTRKGEDQPKLLKMESPQVLDGTSPVYIEPVDPRLTTAQAARRWQFMREDGTWPQVDECNKNPFLEFAWEA